MILSRAKKIFLLSLLVLVSFVLSVAKFISGNGKTSQAQAQCWTAPSYGSSGDCGGYPDACSTTGDCSCGGSDCAGGDCGCSF